MNFPSGHCRFLYVTAFVWLALLTGFTAGVFLPQRRETALRREKSEITGGRLREGKSLLMEASELERETRNISSQILEIHDAGLPPPVQRYGWALQSLSELEKQGEGGIRVMADPELRYVSAGEAKNLHPGSVPLWATYSVKITLKSGFEELLDFLERLHDQRPCVSVAAMEITSLASTPEIHGIELTVEWPVPRFEQDVEKWRRGSRKLRPSGE